jgi:hypothetical protein
MASPGIKVALCGNSAAARPLALPVADVLSEGGSTDNRGLVDLGVLPDIVDGAVAGHRSDLGTLSGSSTIAGVLLDVVLDKRILSPAID